MEPSGLRFRDIRRSSQPGGGRTIGPDNGGLPVIPNLIVAAFLLAHGALHASFLAPPPPAAPGGPTWPFDLASSWLLSPFGVPDTALRLLGIALIAVTIAAFGLAALAALGVLPSTLFVPATAAGAIASLALLIVFFHPWLVIGVAIDVGLLWAVLIAGWLPDASAS